VAGKALAQPGQAGLTDVAFDRETAARMSLQDIGDLLVRNRLLEAEEVPVMSLQEMRAMLAYLSGIRPAAPRPPTGPSAEEQRP
jgi:hypothetical protein